METAQAALAQASRDVSAATDWARIATQIHRRTQLYAERPWLKRASA
jgi:hypothetical protein